MSGLRFRGGRGEVEGLGFRNLGFMEERGLGIQGLGG